MIIKNFLNSIHGLKPSGGLSGSFFPIALLVLLMTVSYAGTPIAARTVVARDTITPAEAFLKIPQQELDLLTSSMRRDMVDYLQLKDSLNYKKINVYNGKSWIEASTPDYMKIHLSDVSDIQIRILPVAGKMPVVMTLYTISSGGDTADTTIKFYDADMQPLKRDKFFRLPDNKDFYKIPAGAEVSVRELEELIPFYTVRYNVEPAGDIMTGRLTLNDYLTQEDAAKIMPFIRQTLRWKWTGRKWQLLKPE